MKPFLELTLLNCCAIESHLNNQQVKSSLKSIHKIDLVLC